ncbi:hypothetical protein ACFL2X_02520 [Candidatus Latescibacterota bacterium]
MMTTGLKSVALILMIVIAYSSYAVHAEDNSIRDRYSHVVLSNGVVETTVFLPDAKNGFSRSVRYDWSGHTWDLTWNGHSYFLQRNEKYPLPLNQVHDPLFPHNGAGFASEFYANGKEDGCKTYLKVGIGHLDSGDSNIIIDSGVWTIRRGKNLVEFIHSLEESCGYGYIYLKKMELTAGKPEMVISHSLRNTGTKAIRTQQYIHNFFCIDNEYSGRNYQLDLPFAPIFERVYPEKLAEKMNFEPYAVFRDNTLYFMKDIEKGNSLFAVFSGFDESLSHNHCIIRNTRTGACVDISGDFSLWGNRFWAEANSFCPELFIEISVEPGETQSWKQVYTFFEE